MSFQQQEGSNFSFYETVVKIVQPCLSFLTSFSLGHPIHPLEPITPQYSEYVFLNNQKRLRVIHIKPKAVCSTHRENKKRVSRNSLSEEYWFTRWNKPLKLGNCNCSFRRSQRFSGLSHLSLTYSPTLDTLTDKVKSIEGFVEHLIQDTLIEAFQDLFKKITVAKTGIKQNSGSINLGFVNNEDNFNDVIIRKPLKDETKRCNHRITSKAKKKPIILLLHGIGDSADVWWNVINIFVHRGYEVAAPDMLGHGYSSVPNNANDYRFQSILQYTLVVFDRYVGCNESKTCIIVAHSYGCSLATALCQHRSQQIIQLILISGGGPTPLAPPANENEISSINCLHTLIKPLLFCGIQRTILYPLRGKHFEACSPNNGVPSYILQYITNGQIWPEGDASFHRRILIPTLLVHGLLDNKVTLVQECEMERTIPRAFLELIPNAGHMCMLETPEHLTHMVMCFIEWWSNGEF